MSQVNVKAVSRKIPNYVGILTDMPEYPERWMSIPEKDGDHIKKGDVINIKVTENGKYLNFELLPDTHIEDGIEKRHQERNDGQAMGNAKTNACNIVVALINCGKVTTLDTAKEYIQKLTEFIFMIK